MKKRIMAVFGTRPDAIKMCPLVKELRERESLEVTVLVTGQHRQMLDPVLALFGISPEYDLALMREGQGLSDLTCALLEGITPILLCERPDLVLVHGDTVSAFGASLAAFYLNIPVGHVEAGLRTYDLSAPFPEEWNRRAVGLMARVHFAPTLSAKENLMREGVAERRIEVTGNTGIDALRTTVRQDFSHPLLTWAEGKRLLMLTAHRRENQGAPMRAIFRGLRKAAEEFPDVRVIYPVHLSPAVRAAAESELTGCERICLTEPMDVVCFHNFLARCYFCVTDSGGIQEEAVSLGKPVLVLRNTTERPEGLRGGRARLIGTGEGSVYRGICSLLEDPALYAAMSGGESLYGDGYASRRIADALERMI